ncbi:MAG: MFS transporter [Alphaproteobacteria bacterium]|nr:MFS transporter [Alphaproteobacteria bacterium]
MHQENSPKITDYHIHKHILNKTLVVVGFGYFIDAFDLFLYNALRVPSLRELGLEGEKLTQVGLWILNTQVIGMLVGGLLWGMLGDKIGRKKALVGSVLVYSLGSLGCAFVQNVAFYATVRFLTGIGLAGEMGLGAILITETLLDKKRDWGLAAYSLFAYAGIISANLLAGFLPWRACYAVGGIVGLLLLLARMMLFESGLYEKLAATKVKRGSLILFLKNPNLLKRYLCCILFAMPYYYTVNLLMTLAPEFGMAVGAAQPIRANIALMVYSITAMIGTVLAIIVGKLLRRRIFTIFLFMATNLALAMYYLTQRNPTATEFYFLCGIMGLANYFVLLLFAAVEQFGTNMRATAGTSALSTGRATLVVTTTVFLAFRSAGLDIIPAAFWVAAIVFAVGFVCLAGLRETYGRSIDFIEETH